MKNVKKLCENLKPIFFLEDMIYGKVEFSGIWKFDLFFSLDLFFGKSLDLFFWKSYDLVCYNKVWI